MSVLPGPAALAHGRFQHTAKTPAGGTAWERWRETEAV